MKTWFVLVACWLALLAAPVLAESEMEADFAWFGKLGFADVKDLPFVHYCYGTAFFSGGKKVEQWSDGFLLKETPETFLILGTNFQTIERTKADHDFDANHRYEAGDLEKFVEAELQPPASATERFIRAWSGPSFTDRTRFFVLAWMCERKGLSAAAGRLYAAAQTARGLGQETRVDETGWSFRDKLDRDLGHFEMWRTVVAFGDLAVSRTELLARLQALPKKYPHCDHLARADAMAGMLTSMIAEDKAHSKRTEAEIAVLPVSEQVAEWVFRLRDQNGWQTIQPGWVDIFETHDGGTDTPAHHLVKLGDAAVPALIAAMEDPRLTRSVGYGRNFYFSHEVITIGDAALAILEKIASRRFYRSGRIQGSMVRDQQTAAVRAALQDWWKNRQSRGPQGELVDTVARGDFGAAQAGAKLLADFPQDAATPILAGAEAAKEKSERCELIRLVGKLKDPRAPEFLLREVRDGKTLETRVEAAWQLARRGKLDGIPPLVDVWNVWKAPLPPSTSDITPGRAMLIHLLASFDSPEAVHALAEGLGGRGMEARKRVLEAFGAGREYIGREFGDVHSPDKSPLPLSAATATELEALLVSELGDFAEYTGIGSYPFGAIFPRARMWDEAATQLAKRWPDRYQFDPKASYPARDRQRIVCWNTWREAHGQPPLPLPPIRPPVAEGDAGKIAEVVIVGNALSWPKPLRALAQSARGQGVDEASFRQLEQTYLDACAGQPPADDLGFSIDVFREKAADGITFLATPVERAGLSIRLKRTWRLDYLLQVGERGRTMAVDLDIFGKNHVAWNRHGVAEIFAMIAELPPDARFHLHVELAPQRWDVDLIY